MRDIRLGDDIDDYCVRCKRVMNHAVVSVMNAEPAKVRCRTCHSDHDFRHEQPPPPKVDPRKAAIFNEVLKKVDPTAEPVEVEVGDIDSEEPIETAEVAESEEAEAPEVEEKAEAATVVKEKPKGKGRARK
jgi:hypothetical protein